MCGIVGYTGFSEAADILLDGLKHLEYRGYDSAGVAVHDGKKISMVKTTGKVESLKEKIRSQGGIRGNCGIGHTRWATHGAPSDVNAHPHMSQDGAFAVVHNGIIENYQELKRELEESGKSFISETDTEVIVQLLDSFYDGNLKQALTRTVSRLRGSYALGVISKENPSVLYAARQSSPLLIGLGSGENFFASDITALISHTRNVIDLDDGEIAAVTPDTVRVFDLTGKKKRKKTRIIDWDISCAEKNGFDHFMLKEIMEQPVALRAAVTPRIREGLLDLSESGISFKKYDRVLIAACGSAFHAGCAGGNVIERLCRIPVTVELASELRYRDPVMDGKTLVIVISQSGETADTIAALKECRKKKADVLAVVNVVGSTVSKLADHILYTWAGPEIAVATTKGYTTQLAVLLMLAVWGAHELGRMEDTEFRRISKAFPELPELAQRTLDLNTKVRFFAQKYHEKNSMFFIGRNLDYDTALEGSLKLKEISYIHSEAYAAGELKHGTIALIEPGRLVVALCCHEALFEKTVSNIQQVKARGARVLAVAEEGNAAILGEADDVLYVPKTENWLTPVLEIIPLQMFAYYIAKENGCDIDKPKNLAKSVTVE